MKNVNVNGLVLSGGLSSRMGKDKGELQYHNKTQRQYLYELLSGYCNKTFISCNTAQSKYITDLPVIVDEYENIGPLGGILSAFKTNQKCAWLVVACDLPFVNEETINYLIAHRNTNKMAIVFLNKAINQPEPLLTIWEPKAYPILLKSIQQNCYSPQQILINNDVELLHAPNASVLKNINTVVEYYDALHTLQQTQN